MPESTPLPMTCQAGGNGLRDFGMEGQGGQRNSHGVELGFAGFHFRIWVWGVGFGEGVQTLMCSLMRFPKPGSSVSKLRVWEVAFQPKEGSRPQDPQPKWRDLSPCTRITEVSGTVALAIILPKPRITPASISLPICPCDSPLFLHIGPYSTLQCARFSSKMHSALRRDNKSWSGLKAVI